MIYTLHGVVDKRDDDAQVTRSFISKARFEKYLKKRSTKFAPWHRTVTGADTLTIDDATQAGAEACLMARHLGHHAVLFVNPWQVAERQPHYFHLLNLVIDNRARSSVAYAGKEYCLEHAAVKAFRLMAKSHIMMLPAAEAMQATLSLGHQLGCTAYALPDFSSTLTISDLLMLRKSGIQIESHGWSHQNIASLSPAALRADITNSIAWVEATVGPCDKLYAVPFGKPRLPQSLDTLPAASTFLADNQFIMGQVSPHSWNRLDLTPYLTQN